MTDVTTVAENEKKSLKPLNEVEEAVFQSFQEGTAMQQMLGAVLKEVGGIEFVVEWAEDNPDKFMGMVMAANPAPMSGGGGGSLNLVIHPALQAGPLDGVKDVN